MKSESKTTAEHLDEIRRIVKWTLWKIATDPKQRAHVRADCEFLSSDDAWVAQVVGQFAANHLKEPSVEYTAFLALTGEDDGS